MERVDLSNEIWETISHFLDLKTLYTTFRCISKLHHSIGYLFQGQQSPTERRYSILYGKPYISRVKNKEWDINDKLRKTWNDVMMIKRNEDGNGEEDKDKTEELMNELVWKILELPYGFFIGGSRAMLLAYELLCTESKYDKNMYLGSDIDIYCCMHQEKYDIKELQDRLCEVLEESRCKGLRYYINVKKYLLNVVFYDKKYPTIQIILHIKKSMDEFMEFVDLPNTQFAFCVMKNEKKSVLYYTENAIFALNTGINIIYEPIIKGTMINRIIKYGKRGFLTVVMSPYGNERNAYQRVVSIFDICEYRHIGDDKYINRIYVDCYLKDIFKIKEHLDTNEILWLEMHEYINILENRVDQYVYCQNIHTRLGRILRYMKLSMCDVSVNRKIRYYYDAIGNHEGYTTYYVNIIRTEHKYSRHKLLKYRDDERSDKHSFEAYNGLRKSNYKRLTKFPYYCILYGNELRRLNSTQLFYTDFVDTFLHKYHIHRC